MRGRGRRSAVAVLALTALLTLLVAALDATVSTPAQAARYGASAAGATGQWRTVPVAAPARVQVFDPQGRLRATLTQGSRSVVVDGPARTFAEPATTSATVTTTSWVRLLPAPFDGQVDLARVQAMLGDRSPDVLATGMSYATGAQRDASYGPLVGGARQEGSDWNDYLQVVATYDGKVDRPEPEQAGALDCSGFVRLVYGHLGGVPTTLEPDGRRLPRRAVQMAASSPGVVVVPDSGRQVTELSALQAGDLVLFDAATDDGTDIDHVGVYLGRDSAGKPRFLSSRKDADGPTMGDVGGRARLDGTGLYAKAFRAVHRL